MLAAGVPPATVPPMGRTFPTLPPNPALPRHTTNTRSFRRSARIRRPMTGRRSMLSAGEVLAAILHSPADLEHVRSLVTDDLTYVSRSYDNPDLHSIMPWCGTHERAGPQSIVQTFVDVGRYWSVLSFEVAAVFGEGEHAAAFG